MEHGRDFRQPGAFGAVRLLRGHYAGHVRGIVTEIKSKTRVLFGRHIENLVREVLLYYGMEHARVAVEDAGALPWVMAARLEAAIKQLIPAKRSSSSPNCPKTDRRQPATASAARASTSPVTSPN